MQIAIAGAGIAGLAAATFLRRQDHDVILFDKLPAPAPVGSGLIVQPTGQAVLDALGVLDQLEGMGARLDRLDGRLRESERRVLDVDYAALEPVQYGIAVHRSVLFGILFRAAIDAGVQFEPNKEITRVDRDSATVVFSDGQRSSVFDVVINAMGVRSPLVSRTHSLLKFGALWANIALPAGFESNILNQRYHGAQISSGVMPIGKLTDDGAPMAAYFWTMRASEFARWRERPLDHWKAEVLLLWPEITNVLDGFTDHEQFVFAQYAHHTFRPIDGRVIHIGDAWHAASPQLGQGANMALLDAWALAKGFEAHTDLTDIAAEFVRVRQNHVRLYQAISWLFTPFFQSDSKILPWMRDVFAQPLSRFGPMPQLLAKMVAGTLGNPIAKLK